MHCNEAERRLRRIEAVGGSPRDDAELADHLVSCVSCTRQAKASELLGQAFADLRNEDTGTFPAWARVKADIESGATAAHRTPGRIAIAMEKIFDPISGHRGRRIGFAAGLAVLAFLTLIPFHYQKTVGYEVAFAGVNKDLAMDQGKIELLLSRLGIGGASVDLGACEATCSLVVSNLKSKGDCQALVYAMKEMGECQVVSEGSPLCEPASGSLVKLAGQKVFLIAEDAEPEHEVQQRVVQCLGEDFPEGMNVWVSKCDSTVTIDVMGVGGCLKGSPQCVGTTSCADFAAQFDSVCGKGNAKACFFVMCDSTCQTACPSADMHFGPIETEAAKEGVVPEEYALDQNYPNPFNPSTTIRFVVTKAEPVKLEVINMLGQRVRTLVDRTLPMGAHELQWDATNDAGKRVPSGTYLYRFSAGDFNASRTMTLLK